MAVVNAGSELAVYEGTALAEAVGRPGQAALRGPAKLKVGSAQRAVVYMWVTLPDGTKPAQGLQHRVTMKLGEGQHVVSTDAGRVAIAAKVRTIGPPLRGDSWAAMNGPSNASGHRRTIVSVDGVARVPQRFGIDWLQIGPDRRSYSGDAKDNKSYLAYGEDAIAVADGIVSAVKDGIPENVPGMTSRAVPITIETVAGNHVILNIGGSAYAFYAHLQPGSLKVKLGDKVRRGQVVGLVGNSGNSTEPHLHFQVSDANSPLGSEGLPYALDTFEVQGRIGSTPLAAPEARKKEMPLANVVVRFPAR